MKKPNIKKLDAKISERAVYFRNRRFSIMELVTENFMTFLTTFKTRKEVGDFFSNTSGDTGVPRLLQPLAEIWTRNSIVELFVDRGVDDESVEESKVTMQGLLNLIAINVPDDVRQDLNEVSLDNDTEKFFAEPLIEKLNQVAYFSEAFPEFKKETFVDVLSKHLRMLMKLAFLQYSFESLVNERSKIESNKRFERINLERNGNEHYDSLDDLMAYFYWSYFLSPSDAVGELYYDDENGAPESGRLMNEFDEFDEFDENERKEQRDNASYFDSIDTEEQFNSEPNNAHVAADDVASGAAAALAVNEMINSANSEAGSDTDLGSFS